MRKLGAVLGVAALTMLAAPGVANAAKPETTTFVAVLAADEEVPLCTEATNASRGVAVFDVVDAEAGTVRYTLVANNLPGDILAAHIHVGPKGLPGPIVQPLALTPGTENGVIGRGTFTNPGLIDAMQADPDGYYVNVHSTTCPAGVIRGQLGDHGPAH